MEFDTGIFAKERHTRLLRELQEERRVASLPRQPRRNPAALARHVLARWLAATPDTGSARPSRNVWQTGEE